MWEIKRSSKFPKIIIARLEREINTKLKTIDYLTQQLMNKESNTVVNDLLTFD